MSSISQLSTNSRSMNGLNTINANAVFTDTLEVGTLAIDNVGTAPTVSALSNDNNIATTAWVTAHAGGAYVTTNTTQTITGQKTFSNANTFITGNTITDSIRSSSSTTAINIGQNIQAGAINLGTTFIGPTMNIPLNWGTSSNSGQLTLRGGSFTLASTGVYTQTSGATFDTNISTNQTSGVLNIGTGASRTGAVNISNNSSATNNISIGNQRTGAGTITIGSNNSSTNILNLQSSEVNIGTVSPVGTTNDVNIGNGQVGSTIILNSETTCIDDLIVNNIVNNPGASMTLTTTGTDDIVITSADKIDLNSLTTNVSGTLFSSNINSPLGTDLVVSAAGLTDTLTLIGGNAIDLIGTTTCNDDFIVNNIKSTSGSMTIATNPVGYTDDITISTANDLTLNAGFNAVINCYQGSFGATNTFGFTSNGSGGMSFNENFGGSVGMNFNGTKISFNNSGLTQFAGSEVSINGGQLTVDAGPFVIKSGGSERLRVNYAIDATTIQIKTDGNSIRFTSNDNSLIMEIQDTLGALYKKGSIYVPDSANFNLIPVGTILTTVTSTVPAGYLYCGGGLQSTTASSSNPYYELFLAIGYTYGGSGASFAIPDFRGMFLRGFGSQTAGGVNYQAGAIGAIQFDQALTTPPAGYATPLSSTGFRSCGSGTRDCIARTSQGDPIENPTGLNLAYPTGRGGTEVRPVNRAVYYYIKY